MHSHERTQEYQSRILEYYAEFLDKLPSHTASKKMMKDPLKP
jgi:hypothetical protein